MPHLKELYQQLPSQGLEVVGISYDGQKSKLENYVRKENIPRAQYFDGKMWDSELGRDFGLRNLPTVALVDKAGVLRFANARNEVSERVRERLVE